MRGAVLPGPGEPVAIEPLEAAPPGPREVVVRLLASGVCHTDVHVVETGGWGMPFPILLGHEGAGVVEEVGEGVTLVGRGDYVVIAWRAPCGRCASCRRGDPRRCSSQLRARRRLRRAADGAVLTPVLRCGTFADRAVVHEACAVRIAEELPPEQACLLACGVSTGVGAALWTAPVRPGSSVAVIGCGGVGLSVVQGARLAHAGRIVAVDLDARKLERARSLGATDAVDAGAGDAVAAVRELTGGVETAFSAVGAPAALVQAVRMCAYGGTAVLVGIPPGGTALDLDPYEDLFGPKVSLAVTHGGDTLPQEDFPLLAGLALAGELDLASLVTREIALDEVPRALEELGRGGEVRSVVRFPGG